MKGSTPHYVETPWLAGLYRSCPPMDPAHWRRCPECDAPMRWDLAGCTGAGRHRAPHREPILYASRTGTRRNLRALAANGYRLLATPHQRYGDVLPPWAFGLDNGAWTAHSQGEPFDDAAYRRSLEQLAVMADWVVLPDIVAGGLDSLAKSISWLDEVGALNLRGPMLLPVQDGMTGEDVLQAVSLGPEIGLFVGGSTVWKEQTMGAWAALARSRGAWCHVGRVNTQRRLAMVNAAGATSCDGTSATVFSVTAEPLANAAKQQALEGLPLFSSDR